MALLNTLDLLYNLIGIRLFNFNYIDLGLFNATWTLIYILSTRFTNVFVDKGFFRKTISISIFFNIVMTILLLNSINTRNIHLYYLSYCLYAVIVSETRIPIYTSILEYYDSDKWSTINKSLIFRIIVFEGLFLITYSNIDYTSLISNLDKIFVIIITLNVISVFVIPQPLLLIERIVYRIEKGINKMLSPVRSSLVISFQPIYLPDKTSIYRDLFSKSFVNKKELLIALFGLKISNEFLFTPLPLILMKNNNLNPVSILQIYGFAKILTFIFILVLKIESLNPGLISLAMSLRTASTILLFILLNNTMLIPILITLIFYSNALLDSILYNLYLETSSGYRTGDYTIVSEVACLTGSLASGYLFIFTGFLSSVITIVFSTLLFTSILKKI